MRVWIAGIGLLFGLTACTTDLGRFRVGEISEQDDAKSDGAMPDGSDGSMPITPPKQDGQTPIDRGDAEITDKPDGMIADAAIPECDDGEAVYPDRDMDGFGTNEGAMSGCPGDGFVAKAGDCDDTDPDRNPVATEACNGIDDNCDLTADEGCDCADEAETACGAGDGAGGILVRGECKAGTQTCVNRQWGMCTNAVLPVEESCNGLDDDCDGKTDEDLTITVFDDADGDGFGRDDSSTEACQVSAGQSDKGGDCDDGNDKVLPGATDTCNGVDDDCDGTTDTGCPCSIDEERPCGTRDGSGNLLSRGLCRPGAQRCEGGTFGACIGAVAPVPEVCNGSDDDCDGVDDNGVTLRCWVDQDADGYAEAGATFMDLCDSACPSATTSRDPAQGNADCADNDPNVHPAQRETCNGADDNCNTMIDEGVLTTFYIDDDKDGFGVASNSQTACTAPAGYTARAGDCQDGDPMVHPGQNESCDNSDEDCDGKTDEGAGCTCTNGAMRDCGPSDGAGGINTTGRCAKGTETCSGGVWSGVCMGATYPVTESCNSIDDDCDAKTDESPRVDCWTDVDGDSYAAASATTMSVCGACGNGLTNRQPTAGNIDCDDARQEVNPGGVETCNGRNDDCDGQTDETVLSTFYRDSDGDNYGNPSQTQQACSAPSGYVSQGNDCNDANNLVYPGHPEECNLVDDNCNGQVDDGISCKCTNGTPRTCGPNTTAGLCKQSTQVCMNGVWPNDCPGAVYPTNEACNGLDDDCDMTVDEGTQRNCWPDQDMDGYAPANSTATKVCANASCPSGTTATSPGAGTSDCNDSNPSVRPTATEICNTVDDNCNGATDEGVTTTYYRDADGDGFGGVSPTQQACSPPSGYVSTSTDCNDNNGSINPAASESCNGLDDNCNGTTDENVKTTFFRDSDGDGFGTPNQTQQACSAPSGYVSNSTDCNDNQSSIKPGATEICNGVDDNCAGGIDEGNPGKMCIDRDEYWECRGGQLVRNNFCSSQTKTCSGTTCVGNCVYGNERCSSSGNYETCNTLGVWGITDDCTATEQCDLIRNQCTDVSPFTIGLTSASGAAVQVHPLSNNTIYASSITVSEDVLLLNSNIIVPPGAQRVSFWMGVYADDGSGIPGTFVTGSNSATATTIFGTPLANATTYTLSPSASNVILAGGSTYWIVVRVKSEGSPWSMGAYQNTSSSGLVHETTSLGAGGTTPLPATFNPGPTTTPGKIIGYLSVRRTVN